MVTVGTAASASSSFASPANSVPVLAFNPNGPNTTNSSSDNNSPSDKVHYGSGSANAQSAPRLLREDGGQSIPLWENDQSTLAAQTTSNKQQMSAVLKATLLVNSAMLIAFCLIIANQFRDRSKIRDAEDIHNTPENRKRAALSQHSVLNMVDKEVQESRVEQNDALKELRDEQRWAQLPQLIASINNVDNTSITSGKSTKVETKNLVKRVAKPPVSTATESAGRTETASVIEAKDGRGVLIIDHEPPPQLLKSMRAKGIGRLAYFFEHGLPAAPVGESALDHATTLKRQRILESETRANQPEHYPGAWKTILASGKGPHAKTLLEHYAYDTAALKNQGWKDELPPTLPMHTWDQMCDWSKGYVNALSDSKWERKVGSAKTLPKLYFSGMRKVRNNPAEIGSKGGRTFFTTLPATLMLGTLVASTAVMMIEMRNKQHPDS